VGLGPLWSVTVGHLDPGEKGPVICFISRNFRKCSNIAKIIEYSLVVKKIQMTYQNVQKNMLYILVSNSCIVKQLEPYPKVEELIIPPLI
jgi:hypothetical protein